MLSRKQFFKNLLLRGFRVASDLTGMNENRFLKPDPPGRSLDLSWTELSPSLLAIEAECRGIDLPADRANELRQEIYQELTQNRNPT